MKKSGKMDFAQIARTAAAGSMALLKNEGGLLPLVPKEDDSQCKIAVFGIGQVYTIKGGIGSGDVNCVYSVSILEGLRACARLQIDRQIACAYESYAELHPNMAVEGFMAPKAYSNEEMPLDGLDMERAARENDAAVIVISRIAGEGADVPILPGGYYLRQSETDMLDTVCRYFNQTVLVLNVPGVMDTAYIDDQIRAVLFAGLPGQEGGHAVADILSGVSVPSGKLTDTWALSYNDYSTSKNFGSSRKNGNVNTSMGKEAEQAEIVYEEDIFVGYRYFDTFGLDVAYPFGFGLGYTDMGINSCSLSQDGNSITITAEIENTGADYPGREVLQIYVSAPEGRLEKPYSELKGFHKTNLLSPGQKETVRVTIPIADLAQYSEKDAAYILEPGYYYIRAGSSSRNTTVIGALNLGAEIKTRILSNRMVPRSPINRLSKKEAVPISYPGEPEELGRAKKYAIRVSDVNIKTIKHRAIENIKAGSWEGLTLKDVAEKRCSLGKFAGQLSLEELAAMACGVGMDLSGLPSFEEGVAPEPMMSIDEATLSVPGSAGETADFTQAYGIPPMVLADGPAGLRLRRVVKGGDGEVLYQQNCTAYPTGSLLGCSWDMELLELAGRAVGSEMRQFNVDLWLAPGMNIHRNPLCGRNFEYYSEDPVLTGYCAAAITRGVQQEGGGVTLKHFAANNQEEDRSNSNSVVSERALREIYLKGFEIAVKAARPKAIMTSYNDVNGVPSADNYDLCTAIARGEWGFTGLIMTDWGGGLSNPALSMYAGNDLIQPGGSTSINAIIEAVKSKKPVVSRGTARLQAVVTEDMLRSCVVRILGVILNSGTYKRLKEQRLL